MNTLTTTALLNMHIHSLPAGGAFGTVSTVTAEHKAAQHWTLKGAALIFIYSFLKFNRHIKLHRDSGLYPNLRPLEIIIKTFLYNLRLFMTLNLKRKFKTLRNRGNPVTH